MLSLLALATWLLHGGGHDPTTILASLDFWEAANRLSLILQLVEALHNLWKWLDRQ